MGETRILLAVEPVPHKRARVWCIDTETGSEVAFATSDDNAQYVLSNLPVGTYDIYAESVINNDLYNDLITGLQVQDGITTTQHILLEMVY